MIAIDLQAAHERARAAAGVPNLATVALEIESRAQHPDRNEDASFAARLHGGTLVVAAVADGSGGSGAGREAARLAIQTLRRRVESTSRALLLDRGFWMMLYREIDDRVERRTSAGRTTLTTIVTDGTRTIAASVGDSLVYHCRGTQAVAVNLDRRSSALLGSDRIAIVLREIETRRRDRLLLATDGLWKYVPHYQLTRCAAVFPVPDVLPHLMGQLSERFSGRLIDDATGVLVGL